MYGFAKGKIFVKPIASKGMLLYCPNKSGFSDEAMSGRMPCAPTRDKGLGGGRGGSRTARTENHQGLASRSEREAGTGACPYEGSTRLLACKRKKGDPESSEPPIRRIANAWCVGTGFMPVRIGGSPVVGYRSIPIPPPVSMSDCLSHPSTPHKTRKAGEFPAFAECVLTFGVRPP